MFGRFSLITVYVILSSFSPDPGWAKEQNEKTIATNEISSNLALSERNLNSLNLVTNSKPNLSLTTTSHAEDEAPQIISQVGRNSPASESEFEFNRGWCWLAIGATSGICLFLLWLLFRKPPQLNESATELNTEKSESEQIKAEIKAEVEVKPVFSSGDRLNSIKGNKDLPEIETQTMVENNHAPVATIARQLAQNLSEPQVEPRRKAIWELAQVGDRHSIEPLLKIMPNVGAVDKELIFEAVNQIINRNFEPANQELFANLQHPDVRIRLNAIRNLKQLYQFVSPAITRLAKMQSDPDYEVRQTATQALRQLNVNPIPPLSDYSDLEIERLVAGEESKENLHLVAYLLAELDVEK